MYIRLNNIKAMSLIETILIVILTLYYFDFNNYIYAKIVLNYI